MRLGLRQPVHILSTMDDRIPDSKECVQRLNTIYAWSRLLQCDAIDGELRVQALESIQRNTERLLGQLTATLEGC